MVFSNNDLPHAIFLTRHDIDVHLSLHDFVREQTKVCSLMKYNAIYTSIKDFLSPFVVWTITAALRATSGAAFLHVLTESAL